MAHITADGILETTTTTGTGNYVLGGAQADHLQVSDHLANNDTLFYVVRQGANYESGLGTYVSAGNQLARTEIFDSSNGGSAVNWPAGTKDVIGAMPAAVMRNLLGHTAPSGIITRTAARAYTTRSLVSSDTDNLVIADGDGIAGNPSFTVYSAPGGKNENKTIFVNRVSSVAVDTRLITLTSETGTDDELVEINHDNHPIGTIIGLRAASGHAITVRHNGGASGRFFLQNNRDVYLDGDEQILFLRRETDWNEVGRNGTTSKLIMPIEPGWTQVAGSIPSGMVIDSNNMLHLEGEMEHGSSFTAGSVNRVVGLNAVTGNPDSTQRFASVAIVGGVESSCTIQVTSTGDVNYIPHLTGIPSLVSLAVTPIRLG